MRREEGRDGIQLRLYRRGAGASGGNAPRHAGPERNFFIQIVRENVRIRLVGFQRQLLKHGIMRDAVRHELTGNFVRTAERTPFFVR